MDTIIQKSLEIALTSAVPAAVIACWLVGWAIKQYEWFGTKHIPITMMIIGIFIVLSMNGFDFSVEKTLIPGMISGAVSVWGYDLLNGYLKNAKPKDKLSDDWKEQ